MSPCAVLLVAITFIVPAADAAIETGTAATVDSGPKQSSAAPARPRSTSRRIFACHDHGIAVFSDLPCDETALPRELVIRTPHVDGGQTPTTQPRATRAATRPKPEPKSDPESARTDARARAAARCRQLEQAVESLDDRMRAGYSAREAARLWQRWRDAKERLRTADCR